MRGYRPIASEEVELDRFPEYENARGDGLTEEEELVIKMQVDVPRKKSGYSKLLCQATRTEMLMIFVSFVLSMVEGASLPLMMIIYGSFAGNSTSFLSNTLGSEQFEKHVNKVALYYVCLGIVVFICNYVGTFSLSYTAEKITERLRQRYIKALFRQNIGFFDFLGPGEITTRITSDMVLIQNGLGQKAFLFTSAISRSIAALIISLSQGWKLSLILLQPSLAMVAIVVFSSKRMSNNQTHAMEEYANASTFAEEVFSSARYFTAYGMQNCLRSKYRRYLDKASRWDYHSKLWLASMIAGTMGMLNLQYSLAFLQGDRFLHSGQLSVSNILTIVSCTTMAGLSFANSLPHFQDFVQASTAATKAFNVIQRKSPIDPGRRDGKIPAKSFGNIDFVNIKHVYPSRPNVVVLKNLNLSVKSGMVVALVGTSGSGKSTVFGLLERFYLPVAGQILLDGIDISTLNLRWLRSQIAIVTQEPVLFNVSIYESIEHGLVETIHEHASTITKRELVETAARLANAHDFILELPTGYQTKIGECGNLLSGGQKQRIAIARAVVSNPRILLLDEATAALDAESEGIVQEALNKASTNRTTMVVAHRLSTIRNADMIVVMASGQIVEQGNHVELIEKRGIYERMINTQELKTHIESAKVSFEMLAGCEVSSVSRPIAADVAASHPSSPRERRTDKRLDMGALISFGWSMNQKEHGLMKIGFMLCMLAGASRSFQAISYGNSIISLSSPDQSTGSHSIAFWCLLYLVLGILIWLVYLLLGFTLSNSSTLLISRVREKTFNAILRQDIAFFDGDAISSGSLISSLSLEANRLAGISGSTLGAIITACATLAVAVIVGLSYGWKLTLISASTTPLVFGCGYFRFYALHEIEKHTKETTDAASFICEVASSMPTIASLSLESYLFRRYRSKLIEKPLHYDNVSAALYAASKGLYMLILALIFCYGGRLMLNHEYTLLQFYIITGAILAGSEDASSAFSFAPEISGAAAAALSLKTSLSRIPDIDTFSTGGKKVVCLSGKIEFRSVDFSYPGHARRRVLCSTTFTVKPGQFVALVGPSGSGKSTVIALLERFFDPTNGHVLVDDLELKNYNIQDYRAQLAIVSQETTLYTGTIRENLLADMNDVSEDLIVKACEDANIYGFIMSLPEGFNTVVGTKGILLSGGQRQRIGIARALLRNPKILLLDEATSALDSTSERLVQNALDAASQGRTTIAVAHRLSTIQNADAIYVFSGGAIVEEGTHKALIKRRGLYWNLARLQGKETSI